MTHRAASPFVPVSPQSIVVQNRATLHAGNPPHHHLLLFAQTSASNLLGETPCRLFNVSPTLDTPPTRAYIN